MGVNTVIYDFDGTIADTNNLIINSWQHAYRTITGKEQDEREILKTFGEPLLITMKRVFPDWEPEEAAKIYRSYQVKHFSEYIRPFPGMVESIKELKNRGCNVGVVTSRMRKTTVEGLEAFGIMDYIDHLVSCEDTDRHKPDPAPVLCALEKFKIGPESAVMVGDSSFDIRCAHNGGVKAALVSWAMAIGPEEKDELDRPDFYLERAEDIFKVI